MMWENWETVIKNRRRKSKSGKGMQRKYKVHIWSQEIYQEISCLGYEEL